MLLFILFLPLLLSGPLCSGTLTGVDRIQESPYREWLEGHNIGLITNQTGVNCRLESTASVISRLEKADVRALFAPEHGVDGDLQAGQEVVSTEKTYSLYGKQNEPTSAMLEGLDILVYDLQDVGSRFYTFISTMLGGMRGAARAGIPFVVLDRPVAIDGTRVEGPRLEKGMESLVGVFSLPVRYAMTPGELASMLNSGLDIGCDLRIVPLKDWERTHWFDQTGLIWVPPSPNMPTLDTATVYPGFCLLEGTNLSEGRGTTLPFERFGAPWLHNTLLASRLNSMHMPGVLFRPQLFQPTFSKYRGQVCRGIQVHVVDRRLFLPVETIVRVLSAVRQLHPRDFQFSSQFDALAGSPKLRLGLERGEAADTIISAWRDELLEFKTQRSRFLLYPEVEKEGER